MAFYSIEVNWLPVGNMAETGASWETGTRRLAKYTSLPAIFGKLMCSK
jgi:hypothetical protein